MRFFIHHECYKYKVNLIKFYFYFQKIIDNLYDQNCAQHVIHDHVIAIDALITPPQESGAWAEST